jgi:molybdopterin/thiamine biosynthesis adenylyltransferase/rhodanese-related sulfurtransferase
VTPAATTDPPPTAESGTSGLRRFARQISLPGFGLPAQQKLAEATVLCLGAGGLGCPALLHLAAAGVGHLVIVDDDTVALSNLHRQTLFTEADVGRPKAEAAAARLASLHSALRITVVRDRFRAANAMQLATGCSAIVDGTDNFETRYLSSDVACWLGIPNVYGAVSRFEGQLSVFHPAAGGPCYRCMFPTPPPPGSVPTCAETGVLGTITGLIGTLQASETIKLLTGLGSPLTGQLFHCDLLTMQTRTLQLRRDPLCPVCSAAPSIHNPTDTPSSCQLPPAPVAVRPADFHAALQQPDVTILDVREPWEVTFAPFPHASLAIPASQLPDAASNLPRHHRIIAICSLGPRSATAAATLRSAGFSSATFLAGGIDALPD